MPSKEEVLSFIQSEEYEPIKIHGIAEKFGLDNKEEKKLEKTIEQLIKQGYVVKDQRNKNRIVRAEEKGIFRGVYSASEDKYGFVVIDGDDENKIFIEGNNKNNAIHNDLVVVRIIEDAEDEDQKDSGEIIRILDRGLKEVIGTFEKKRNFGVVIPDDKRIHRNIRVEKNRFGKATDGDRVVCNILKNNNDYENDNNLDGNIKEIIGKKGDRDLEIKVMLRENNLSGEFSPFVIRDAKKIEAPIEEDFKNRLDLRKLNIFTIDGEESKDLDDAISIEKLENGNYKLGVHIADVAHYVKEGSRIDEEALKRGTSIYLVDRVIPMIIEDISNGVCSLNPNEDKLTLSVIMELDLNGNVVDYEIKESIINSKLRTSYNDVSDILEKEDEYLSEKYRDFIDDFRNAEKLMKILKEKRKKRGAISLGGEKMKISLDDNGKPISLDVEDRRVAEEIIEEFMIITNEVVAEHFYNLKVPFVYRVHENPDKENIDYFSEFAARFGYDLDSSKDILEQREELNNILKESERKKDSCIIKSMVLRTLEKARYSDECIGHFGISNMYYCHFTSPIRRYADLLNHRIIKETINGEMDENRKEHFKQIVGDIAEKLSEKEKTAEYVEREVFDYYKTLYMHNKLDEEFIGIITNVTYGGIFVELSNKVTGRVKVGELSDGKYELDEDKLCLRGITSGKVYSVGDEIKVKVSETSKNIRKVDLKISRENREITK
ncbi:ribonuclease R [Peptacetobacter hiranonis]|uniref:ribonuclease R n=1 Tax=Peptacetobacter hiranonis TaxID=89152 RepID=UPI0022E658D8|nr:ribonuclease R [Peptacetobacter hiranonis]